MEGLLEAERVRKIKRREENLKILCSCNTRGICKCQTRLKAADVLCDCPVSVINCAKEHRVIVFLRSVWSKCPAEKGMFTQSLVQRQKYQVHLMASYTSS